MANLVMDGVTLASKSGSDISLVLPPSSAPSSPTQGQIYLDSASGHLKIYVGSSWQNILGVGTTAIGGTITNYTNNGVNYRVHTFTSNDKFSVLNSSSVQADILVISGGGGGGGGNGANDGGGGGGAGGFIIQNSYTLSPQSYDITIGAGGSGGGTSSTGSNGGTSSFGGLITPVGGGAGGGPNTNGNSGGSGGGGGGGGGPGTGGSGTTGQGFAGGTAIDPRATGS